MQHTWWLERFEPDEQAFLQKKYEQESSAYLKGMRIALYVTVGIPFCTALIYYLRYRQSSLMYQAFLLPCC